MKRLISTVAIIFAVISLNAATQATQVRYITIDCGNGSNTKINISFSWDVSYEEAMRYAEAAAEEYCN